MHDNSNYFTKIMTCILKEDNTNGHNDVLILSQAKLYLHFQTLKVQALYMYIALLSLYLNLTLVLATSVFLDTVYTLSMSLV